MNFIDQVKNIRFEQKIQYAIILFLFVIIIVQSMININLSNANNRSYYISIPPTLEFGLNTTTNTKTPFEIHQFAGYIEQQLYFWQQDGAVDFKENIENKLWPFITQEYQQYLFKKYQNLLNLGELSGREKTLQPLKMFHTDFVNQNKKGWEVQIDFNSQEFLDGNKFKDKNQRHFVQVVLSDTNPEINPWGLKLDVPRSEPLEIR
jgi:integrating conjugative element protein (TIGR03746 family)